MTAQSDLIATYVAEYTPADLAVMLVEPHKVGRDTYKLETLHGWIMNDYPDQELQATWLAKLAEVPKTKRREGWHPGWALPIAEMLGLPMPQPAPKSAEGERKDKAAKPTDGQHLEAVA